MNIAFGVLIAVCASVVCVLALLLNPGLGVLFVVVSVLAGVYALRSVGGRAARARRKRSSKRS